MSPKRNVATCICISTLTVEHTTFPSLISAGLQILFIYEVIENKRELQVP